MPLMIKLPFIHVKLICNSISWKNSLVDIALMGHEFNLSAYNVPMKFYVLHLIEKLIALNVERILC